MVLASVLVIGMFVERLVAGQQTSGPGRVVATMSLESLRIPAVVVELVNVDTNVVVARSTSDAVGQVAFPDVPAGRYTVHAKRDGFADVASPPFTVHAGGTEQVLVEMHLVFIRESVSVVAPANSPTQSVQPVAVSDVLSASKMDVQPLAGDDYKSLLTILPSVIRGPEGRLRIKGGSATTGALQLSSASLNDPSTGDFDLELPSGAVESVEVLSNPFAAEYGRFSTSVTQVRTRAGTNEWMFKPGNLMPGIGGTFVDKFEPRLSISGPIKKDKFLFGEYLQYRYVRTEVKSLPARPTLGLDSFDSFTRLDGVFSSRHSITGGVVYFPRKITNATMDTFRPPETTPKFTQSGFAAGFADRYILADNAVLETTFASRVFEVDQTTQGTLPMVYAPQTQSGNYFGRQKRNVHSLQLVEALTVSRENWAGQHVFKFGVDVQRSGYDGDDYSQPVEVRRLDGSLAELTTYAPALTHPDVSGTELGLFAQDRWRLTDRIMFELGLRVDRDDVVERVNYSPRGGVSFSVLPEGRGILRGGVGKFNQRTPLNVGAFTQLETATVARYNPDGSPQGSPITYAHVIDGPLKTPESLVETLAWDQRIGRKVFFKAAYLHRAGSTEAIVDPDPKQWRARVVIERRGNYWELETTGRYRGEPIPRRHRVVRARPRHHRPERLRSVLRQLPESDHPRRRELAEPDRRAQPDHRARDLGSAGTVGALAALRVADGFSVVRRERVPGFCGRAESGRPAAERVDTGLLAGPAVEFWKYRFSAGVKVYNIFNGRGFRDVQNNVTSPDYGTFYNQLPRSIGFAFGSSKP